MTATDLRKRVTSSVARLLGRPGTKDFREFAPVVAEAMSLIDRVPARGTGHQSSVDDIDAYRLATIAGCASAVMGFPLHPEQMLGACALIAGNAVEMETGEGKTITGAVAAAYLALDGRHVHVLSINDFLARRDATWMHDLYERLGLAVGWVAQGSTKRERTDAYAKNIVYASISEVGYDVLRDRFALSKADRVDPVFDVAIVDEADAVLIDEAMAPLVLAGMIESRESDGASDGQRGAALVESLEEGTHFVLDADGVTASFTEEGLDEVEKQLGGINLYSGEHTRLLTAVNLALHAKVVMRRDVDYLVKDGEIKLINATRGRVAELQRWPDGLHAAVEAKERLSMSAHGVVLDTITVQDLALRYRHLSGMSATTVAVADDLDEFYTLPSGRIDRHRPLARVDRQDVVFLERGEMLNAAIEEVARIHRTGQPVLVGTQSVAESEEIEARLAEQSIKPTVLNAKNDAAEAAVIAQAGSFGAVTISTQISGRGTDIVLGGPDGHDRERVATAGLAVVAIGRYPSRRLDAQLRGRSGRQGDPGMTVGFSSLEDDLIRANYPEQVPTEGAVARERLTPRRRRSIANRAQQIAENARLERHRSTWAYNRAIAWQRGHVLRVRENILTTHIAAELLRDRDPDHVEALVSATSSGAHSEAVRRISLAIADESWADHLALLQELRDGIHLRALAGEDPLDSFHTLALEEFDGWEERLWQAVHDVHRDLAAVDILNVRIPETVRVPSAIWTYMISDNPFGDAVSRISLKRRRSRWESKIV
ncbi:accessory Sec system translocase SecA2 [uncultured Leifsonia sp.]|uniref:accessory Sec system translocase SecA2 n=1 Tax=uncultured Leifsonia sp. TaxID=340359 RepID=UPI0028D4D246|nr:accessory Sec system translocase SecA2 [uncultured Leifsonia sp.]